MITAFFDLARALTSPILTSGNSPANTGRATRAVARNAISFFFIVNSFPNASAASGQVLLCFSQLPFRPFFCFLRCFQFVLQLLLANFSQHSAQRGSGRE